MERNNKVILQYDLEGNFLESYEDCTIRAIANELGIDETDLGRAINNKIETAGSYQWRVQDRNRIPTKIAEAYKVYPSQVEVKVAKYYKGRLISVYDSLTEAAYKTRLDIFSISRVSNGIEQSIGNFVFKRIE